MKISTTPPLEYNLNEKLMSALVYLSVYMFIKQCVFQSVFLKNKSLCILLFRDDDIDLPRYSSDSKPERSSANVWDVNSSSPADSCSTAASLYLLFNPCLYVHNILCETVLP